MSYLDDRSESQQRVDYASRAFYHRVTHEGLRRTTALDQVTEEWELSAEEQAAVLNAQPPNVFASDGAQSVIVHENSRDWGE